MYNFKQPVSVKKCHLRQALLLKEKLIKIQPGIDKMLFQIIVIFRDTVIMEDGETVPPAHKKSTCPPGGACAGKYGAQMPLCGMLCYFLLHFFHHLFGFNRVPPYTDSIHIPTNFFVKIFIRFPHHGQHKFHIKYTDT